MTPTELCDTRLTGYKSVYDEFLWNHVVKYLAVKTCYWNNVNPLDKYFLFPLWSTDTRARRIHWVKGETHKELKCVTRVHCSSIFIFLSTSFSKIDGSVLFLFVSQIWHLREWIITRIIYICELHVSSPYEFLVKAHGAALTKPADKQRE